MHTCHGAIPRKYNAEGQQWPLMHAPSPDSLIMASTMFSQPSLWTTSSLARRQSATTNNCKVHGDSQARENTPTSTQKSQMMIGQNTNSTSSAMKPRGRSKWAALLSSGCFSYSLIYFMFINDVTVGFNDVLNCIKVVPILSDDRNSRGSRVLEVFRYLNVQSTMTSGLKIRSTVIILTMPKTTENVAAL